MTVQGIAEAIQAAAAAMTDAGDHTRGRQARELNSKLTEGRLTVALCGHFSAGKSTLVNQLCGAKLLPSSPIPTSANVVSIRGGERAYAAVVKVAENGKTIQAEVPIDELDQYCVDGERYLSVSIVYPSETLGSDIVLLDTPGIDSTDDAHRMSTESALHLADVVFYVMDYNHVQSEINFAFAKELKDWGKPLYFIVNQIDKHRDRELSFDAYRRSVEEAFQAWHLEPAGIVYLSLRHPQHPHHEWDKLAGLLKTLATMRQELCVYSVDASLRHLLESHLKWADDLEQPERDRLLEEAGGEETAKKVAEERARLQASLSRLSSERDNYRGKLRLELQSILDNANITPAGLRDLAHQFLESRKPGFKTGLLFSGAKTAAEQERRANAFLGELSALIGAAIEWHVKQLLRNAGSAIRYPSEKMEERLAAHLSWLPDSSWMIARVKQGAVMGNEYTMIYSKELAADIKGVYRQHGLDVIDELTSFASVASEKESEQISQELASLTEQAGALERLTAMESNADKRAEKLRSFLPEPAAVPSLPEPASNDSASIGTSAHPIREASAVSDAKADGSASAETAGLEAAQQRALATNNVAAIDSGFGTEGKPALSAQRQAAARLLEAAEMLEPHPTLRSAASAMKEKAARLQSSKFTIALFGAFSAGKSSLANALIGDSVLPVSPNPTTAAINRLMPSNEHYAHGEARVVMKSKEAVLADLRYSLSLLGEQATEQHLPDASALMKAIDRLTPQSIGAGGRPHYSFLRAARAGWQEHEQLLGKELKCGREEYVRYVAEESRSCFVSEIDFHYDCPLTREGIVLVDTPGADSVNARHTGVAFNYIKNADAVLFVTYYNHAFSQADRQFLDQLGRVKDQFELDKMFFIVNAADLASDEEELQGVLRHVESNLLQHSIRSPRLFPVSSIQALDGKMDGNEKLLEQSRMLEFQHSFLSFIQNDLGRLAVESAHLELGRAIERVGGWLRGAEGDASVREKELVELEQSLRRAELPLEELKGGSLPEGMKQEAQELLYYVIQRLQYRFGDFYHLAFNPSTLQDDGRELRRVIWTAWLELQRLMQRELSQELLATTLRMERAIVASLKQQYERCCETVESYVAEYSALPFSIQSLIAPEEAKDWEAEGIDAKWLWGRFKSPRQFFEGDGKTLLRKELEALLAPALQQWTGNVAVMWTHHYEQEWEKAALQAKTELHQDLTAYADGKRTSLTDHTQLDQMKQLHDKLIHL